MVWINGDVGEQKYAPFLDISRARTFEAGEDLIGKVFNEGGVRTVNVLKLDARAFTRLEAAI